MKKLLSTVSLDTDIATLLMRIFFGGMFVYYGYGKLVNYDAILPMFGDIIGIGSKLSFNLVIFAEFFCGLFILFGFFTRFAVVFTFITMVVAFFVAHAADEFQVKTPAFIFMILSIIVFILGSGKYSVDYLFLKPKAREKF